MSDVVLFIRQQQSAGGIAYLGKQRQYAGAFDAIVGGTEQPERSDPSRWQYLYQSNQYQSGQHLNHYQNHYQQRAIRVDGGILDVVPRINPGGVVYMDIQQQVSDASMLLDCNGNPSISTRVISTQVAVQSGQTVLLGDLIKRNEANCQSRVHWLGLVPGLGGLFSDTLRSQARMGLIVLITPKVERCH